ncbi:MAG: ABC transporter ATP-binding protein [Planctomycetes bacterium]|nr:ABC transporter ATP-binding protein [Planctomycetota bacterium]
MSLLSSDIPPGPALPQNVASKAVVETQNLRKVFKDFWGRPKAVALDNISLKLHPGEVCALIGPNGSGKTTLIKILLGLLYPTGGSAQVFGDNCFEISNKARIGFLPENNYFYEHLTGLETLHFHGKLLGLPKKERKERVEYVLEITRMKNEAHRTLSQYSLGMTRRMGIAQALLADPELLILDEPTNGLDPVGIDETHKLIDHLKQRGKTILICTHLLAETEDICNHIGVLLQGKMLTQGSLKDLYQEHQTESMKELFLKVIRDAQGPEYSTLNFSKDTQNQSDPQEETDPSIPSIGLEQNDEQPHSEGTTGPDQDYLDSLSKD